MFRDQMTDSVAILIIGLWEGKDFKKSETQPQLFIYSFKAVRHKEVFT